MAGLPSNRDRKAALKTKIDAVVEPPKPPEPPTPPTPPAGNEPPAPPTPPTPEPEPPKPPEEEPRFDIDELADKKKEDCSPEELEFLKEYQDFLDDDQKIKFGFKEAPKPPEPPKPPEANPDEVDWQRRYAGSTREAQVLVEAKKKLTSAVDDAENLPAPTDEEMKKAIGDDWDIMDDAQKTIAREREHNNRKLAYIRNVRSEFKKADEFVDKAKQYVEDPEVVKAHPKLEGHEQEFLQYCAMPSHIGVDFDVLYRAFTTELPQPKAPKRKTLFEPGGSSVPPVQPKTTEKLTPEQAAFMRTHDPKGYKKAVQEHRIPTEV